MLTTRIIGVLNILDGIVVQSVNFLKYLPIGNPSIAVTFLNKWGIDEIIIQDIKATNNSECYLYKSLPKYVVNCQVPIAAGGGIKNLKDIENLIRNGADKVIINSAAHSNSKVINEGAKEFGDQAIIISIDIKKINDKYVIFTNSGRKKINLDLIDYIKMVDDFGVGEIILNSIDRNGTKQGYDLELLEIVQKNTSLPLIGNGGASRALHFNEAMFLNLSGLAAGNFFHYTEHSVITTKSYLKKYKNNIRSDTYANYLNSKFNIDERTLPPDDKTLENLKYNFIPEEKI